MAFSGEYFPFEASVADATTGEIVGDMFTRQIQPQLFPKGDLSWIVGPGLLPRKSI